MIEDGDHIPPAQLQKISVRNKPKPSTMQEPPRAKDSEGTKTTNANRIARRQCHMLESHKADIVTKSHEGDSVMITQRRCQMAELHKG
jgi:hypothetical protein